MKVLVVGSMNADFTIKVPDFPQPGETVTGNEMLIASGGKSSNQAAAAALLGAEVILVGAVGSDYLGSKLVSDAAARGVDVSRVRHSYTEATGTALVAVNADGENTIIVASGANAGLSTGDVQDKDLEDAPVVVMALEIPMSTVVSVAERASEAGARVLLNASPTQDLPGPLLQHVDVLVVNEGELAQLLGDHPLPPSWEQRAERLQNLGVRSAVVTLGAKGSIVLDNTAGGPTVTHIDAVPVEVKDTTGSGDAFLGAVAAELAAGLSLQEAARTGALAGAWAARSQGAQTSYGTRAEIETLAPTLGART
ncbi:ribokinase [Arthrobacter sp. YN]|uniref:ribokinase n=1 Tax=Arthrobacter sp. YN TaxID=2020486 RepID=UPI0012FD07F8|nr:ribokinase [Arthrobacter sp. YN]